MEIASVSLAGTHEAAPGGGIIERMILDGKAAPVIKQVIKLTLKIGDRASFCSASIISKNTVVTAAHCAGPGTKVEAPNKTPMECIANKGFQQAKEEDVRVTDKARADAVAACNAAKGGGPAGNLDQLEQVYLESLKKTWYINEGHMANDLAVCKLTSGTFDVPPAKIASADLASQRYLLTGFGCYQYAENEHKYPNELFVGAAKLRPDRSKGFLTAEYRKGDPTQSGLCGGDSGGGLIEKTGEGVNVVAVNSGGTTGGRQYLNRNVCRFLQKGSESGESVMTDLGSETSKRFLAEAASMGYDVGNGAKGGGGAPQPISPPAVGQHQVPAPQDPGKAPLVQPPPGQPIPGQPPIAKGPHTCPTGPGAQFHVHAAAPRLSPAVGPMQVSVSQVPTLGGVAGGQVIPLGVPHPQIVPVAGMVYQIGGKPWRYAGNGQWVPASAP